MYEYRIKCIYTDVCIRWCVEQLLDLLLALFSISLFVTDIDAVQYLRTVTVATEEVACRQRRWLVAFDRDTNEVRFRGNNVVVSSSIVVVKYNPKQSVAKEIVLSVISLSKTTRRHYRSTSWPKNPPSNNQPDLAGPKRAVPPFTENNNNDNSSNCKVCSFCLSTAADKTGITSHSQKRIRTQQRCRK